VRGVGFRLAHEPVGHDGPPGEGPQSTGLE
jgi:hypothetical protein